ncbi:MAG: hypothetical protein RL264_2753 [Bacteroidota bacterium]|jgi:hypothetical protein
MFKFVGMTLQDWIQARYAGSLNETNLYVQLSVQAIAVLIGGLVLWRLSLAYQRKKINERKRNNYFTTSYSKHWKK